MKNQAIQLNPNNKSKFSSAKEWGVLQKPAKMGHKHHDASAVS